MRGLSGVCAGVWLLGAVGCSAAGSQGAEGVPPGLANCPVVAPGDLAGVRAGLAVFEKGLIAPPNSVACTAPSTGLPQLNCNHDGSSVVVLPDGSLAAAWYHGTGDKSLDSRLLWARRPKGAVGWTTPAVLYDDPTRAEGSPALWVAGDGALAAFFVTLYGSDWIDARPFVIRSADGGLSWSPPLQLNDRCWMVSRAPLRLHSGELVLPLYDSCLAVPVFMRSAKGEGDGADGKSWQPGPEVPLVEHFQQIQPALIQRADGTVVALTHDASTASRIAQMSSTDEGLSWTPSTLTELPSPNTAMDQLRLPSGHVVVVFNNDPDTRFPLTAALSLDEGRTLVAMRSLLADCPEGPGKCAYTNPALAADPNDGTLWVTYSHNLQTIGWVHFSEAWLAAGTDTALIRCTAYESCSTTDHTCQRLCQSDRDCSRQAVPMHCAAGGRCQPICPDSRPALAHCMP